MRYKYDGEFMQSLSDAVERAFQRWLGSERRVLGHPGAITGHSRAVVMDDIDDYEHADHTKSAGWLRAHGYDESDEVEE